MRISDLGELHDVWMTVPNRVLIPFG